MEQAAISTPEAARRGSEYFAAPAAANQRRYEALRAYLFEGVSAAEAATRFGYTLTTLQSLVRDFRAGRCEFFQSSRPGPKTAPAKEAARTRIIELRRLGHSAQEIAAALAEEDTPLNRTGVAEVLAEEGFPRLWPRPHAERGLPRRESQPRTKVIDFAVLPAHADTRMAGLLLTIPDLVALDLPGLVRAAGYPGTSVIPAISSILSLLAIKLTTTRRVSHIDDIATDPGAALFAGLTSLPKATALTTYSYRLDHTRQQRFLAALDKASLAAGLAHGEAINLDFHAVMHWGADPALEKHYVPRRSQRTRSVLTFFAEDAATHTLLYANADLAKANQNNEILAFADHWRTTSGADPKLLIFDSKVTTQAQLADLDARGIAFITLRARTPKLTEHLHALPAKDWTPLTIARAGGKTRRVRVIEDPAATLSAYPSTLRQLAITGLGHDEPTILITNNRTTPTKHVIEAYARRMNIEQRLAEAIRSFGLDALAGAVPLNIDLDVVLSVLAHTICAALRRRLPGYATATPDTLQRRFLSTGGTIENRDNETIVRLDRRAYSPVLRHADLPTTEVPWWGGRHLRYEYE
ncbi:helix-turn-helix domain-containing protein [Actinopolymorpha pittospori]|uniref:Transposase n=1 Tax=Actinopolymorpha pittospori TaxID=648752 RepID=A0A927MS67_9ACTN|nr:transposase [Actinopolymorpha pittospori]MBE1604480.1 transposase [Actinopolymorpha pittospori]MBE1605302.1 transposase [Actinopolymorpha pittospori]MBE1605304.1 transposase [Actinopolymorpha pittospori]MBE1608442.1 transposase [Actinopolymorpha pittospori]